VNLHTNTVNGSCVAVKDTECFSGENKAEANGATRARKVNGTCQTLVSGECWDTATTANLKVKTKPTNGEDTAALTFARASNTTCVSVTQKTQCYNTTIESAKTVNKVSTLADDNTCKYVLTGGEC
jgi:hypothetical protein